MESQSESIVVKLHKMIRQDNWLRWLKYLVIFGLCNGTVWVLALSYLKKTPPSYTSSLLLHVAGGGPGVSLNLPDIGQANTSSGTSFGADSDPRENYKLMLMSSTILKSTAEKLKISEAELGKPQVELVQNTTLLEITLSARQPQEASQKLWAIYHVLYDRLNVLRAEEQAERNKGVQKALANAQKKLIEAQKRLSDYKITSGLSSVDQVKDLIGNLGTLQTQLIEAQALYQEKNSSLQQLSTTLQLSPQQAADALVLQTDQEFQKSLKEYTDVTTLLNTLSANRGSNYPDVREAKRQQQAALTAMLQRGQILLRIPLEQLKLERLILDNSNGSGVKRADLFTQLVNLSTEKQGIAGKIATLTEKIAELEARLQILSQKESVFASLDRDLQIAQAVFASTLTKIDLSQNDPFGSFPLIYIIEEPNIPTEPSAPQPKLVLAGALIGSMFVTMGLTLLWWREPLLSVTKVIIRKAVE
jgi:uncharacterized protein involved in exopolysaccharide biosynthesis